MEYCLLMFMVCNDYDKKTADKRSIIFSSSAESNTLVLGWAFSSVLQYKQHLSSFQGGPPI